MKKMTCLSSLTSGTPQNNGGGKKKKKKRASDGFFQSIVLFPLNSPREALISKSKHPHRRLFALSTFEKTTMGRKRRGGGGGGSGKGGGNVAAAAASNPFEEAPDPPRPVLALSPDGSTVAAAYGGKVLLLDVV